MTYGVGVWPNSVALGDFTGDGMLDLAVADSSNNVVGILLNGGGGVLGAQSTYAAGNNPFSLAVGDFNGDGLPDIAAANYLTGANGGAGSISVLLNQGAGTFGAPVAYQVGSSPIAVALGDFNGDGILDLAVANQNSDTVGVLLGTGSGTFGAQSSFPVGAGPASVAVGDFNGDGILDLAVANNSSATVSILLGTGTGSFGAQSIFSTGASPISVAVGDFNGDGSLDLAVANNGGSSVSVLMGTGTGGFGAQTLFPIGQNPVFVTVADFDGDGIADLAVTNGGNDSLGILMGTGTGSFNAQLTFPVGSNPYSIAVGDLVGNGQPDVAVANKFSNNVSIFLGPCNSLGSSGGSGSSGSSSSSSSGGSSSSGSVPTIGMSCDPDAFPDPCTADNAGLSCNATYDGAYDCTLPGEFEPCLASPGCGGDPPGLQCLNGGAGDMCYDTCTTGADCPDSLTSCFPSNGYDLCLLAPCDVDYAPCNNAGVNDGFCLPYEGAEGPESYCVAGGTVPAGNTGCSIYRSNSSTSDICEPGSICLAASLGPTGLCAPVCGGYYTSADGGPGCPGQEACLNINDGNLFDACLEVCFAGATTCPAGTSCQAASGGNVCWP